MAVHRDQRRRWSAGDETSVAAAAGAREREKRRTGCGGGLRGKGRSAGDKCGVRGGRIGAPYRTGMERG